ncbi:MAG: tetratricopeptide repeat protein [Campylobacterales bacterium]|nr:tetratricopeptide repeat protein [Campylobacterales bacterium]
MLFAAEPKLAEKSFEESPGMSDASSQRTDEQELKMLFQVFVYANDLENAYKTGKKALAVKPNSLYWHQKLAEVSMWTSRHREAVEHMLFVYRHEGDKALEEKLFQHALATYQFKTAAELIEKKVRKEPSEENVRTLVYLFDLIGKPFESAEILEEIYRKEPSRKALLKKILQIYLNMGEIEHSGRIVMEMEVAETHDVKSAFLRSRYYFLKRDISKSYAALESAELGNADEDELRQYYMHLSDLGWYMKEYNKAAEASVKVDEAAQARLVDYERILAVYKKDEPARAMKAALDAYKKFKQPYLFYTYAYMALEMKSYNELEAACTGIDQEEEGLLTQEAFYWLVKAQLYGYLKEKEKAKEAFAQALDKAPESEQITQSYIWFLIETKEQQALSALLFEIEKTSVRSGLWLPMAVAYFRLQNPDRALLYINRLREVSAEDRDISLLYAYVKQAQNDKDAFYKEMRAIKEQMDIELKGSDWREKKPEFVQDYLSVRLFFINPDQFEKELEEARSILNPQAYSELSLAWALRENVDEQVHLISQSLKSPEPWIRLNLAITANDRSTQQELLYRHFRILPVADSIGAAVNTMQIAFAQELLFDGLEKNEKNELLYEQMRQLHNEHADAFMLDAGYLDRNGLSQYYSQMRNSYYLAKGYSLEGELFAGTNTISDDAVFRTLPSTSRSVGLGIKKRFQSGSYQVDMGLRDSAEQYAYLSLKANRTLSERISLELLADKGALAQESVYLLSAGQKDRLALQLHYRLLGSSQMGLYLESARYRSQDGAALGSGTNGRIDYTYQQRSAYPDLAITSFYTYGKYSENKGSKGAIDALLNFADTPVISDDYWYLGTDLNYGMENRYNYVRVWRPFFSLSPYYNGRTQEFNYGFNAGMGGALFGGDNLSILVDYAQSVGGTDDTSWRSSLRYTILY